MDRIRTIGTHKLLGATRARLIKQLLGETLLVSLFAFLLSFLVAGMLLPVFNQLSFPAHFFRFNIIHFRPSGGFVFQ
jgi:putative ABC transport system permease protein